jgi:5S rRNA maturation endonuclease (ribonuclease M5)
VSGEAFQRTCERLDSLGLKASKHTATEALYQCPAHPDKSPSLSVSQRGARVLVHCLAGCSQEAVRQALAFEWRDFTDDRDHEVYDYRAADGSHVKAQIRNLKVKGFRQVGDTKAHLLYRLPEVIRAVAEGVPVWFVEGEKDANRLASLGLCATTNDGGAGGLSPSIDLSALAGANVVVIPDRDAAGTKWAATLATRLAELTSSVTWRQAQQGKDVSDHLDAGLTLDDLEDYPAPIAEALPRPSVVTLSTVTPEKVAWLWPGRLPLGKLVMLDGDPALGKSTLALDWAAHISTGSDWPDGHPCPVGDVLVMSAEDSLADTIAPRLKAAGADMDRVHALENVPRLDSDGTPYQAMPTIPRDVPTIRGIIDGLQIRLLIIDVMNAYIGDKTDTNNDHAVRVTLAPLQHMAADTGCCVVLIRHLNKSGVANALYRGGGSIGIIGAARGGLIVCADSADSDRRLLAVSKSNLCRTADTLAYRLVDVPQWGCARIEWETSPVAVTASELLAMPVTDEEREDASECLTWLVGCLTDQGGEAPLSEILRAGKGAGFTQDQIKKTRQRARDPRIETHRKGYQGGAVWALEGAQSPLVPFMPTPAPMAPMAPMARMEDTTPTKHTPRKRHHK